VATGTDPLRYQYHHQINFDTFDGPRTSVPKILEIYNGIVRFPCHSTAFLLVFVCRLQTMVAFSKVSEE